MNTNQIEFTRINNDTCGNPRYVCHFTNLLKEDESEGMIKEGLMRRIDYYGIAVKRANKIGGRKFHNKQYGGGIVFQSYNIADTSKRILDLINEG